MRGQISAASRVAMKAWIRVYTGLEHHYSVANPIPLLFPSSPFHYVAMRRVAREADCRAGFFASGEQEAGHVNK